MKDIQKEMIMRQKVEVGDWSNDGHNQSDTYIIEVPEGVDVAAAYKRAVDKLGFALENYCTGYEDNKFPSEHVAAILALADEHNIPVEFSDYSELRSDDDFAGMNEPVFLTPDDFFVFWLTMVNIGSDLVGGGWVHEIKPELGTITHNIGGYGLYSC